MSTKWIDSQKKAKERFDKMPRDRQLACLARYDNYRDCVNSPYVDESGLNDWFKDNFNNLLQIFAMIILVPLWFIISFFGFIDVSLHD